MESKKKCTLGRVFDNSTSLALCITFVACIGVTIILFSDGISGNDFWWHIKIGEWIVEHRQIPTTAIYSWAGTEKNISWTAHEWLSEVLFYLVYSGFGETGIYWMCLLLALILELLLWREVLRFPHRNILLAGLYLALFAVTVTLFIYGRPHIFSYFLLFAELKLLYGFMENPKSHRIYLIPLIGCLWSNLHGGSANLSYLLCLLLLIVGLFSVRFGKIQTRRMDGRSLGKLGAVTLCTAAAIL